MPKIIENLRDRLIDAAKMLFKEHGSDAVTIRAVAAACGVGVGTVYNYFPSKDALLVAFLLEDWTEYMDQILAFSQNTSDATVVLRYIYDKIIAFGTTYSSCLSTAETINIFANTQNNYHVLLRTSLAQALEKFCDSTLCAKVAAGAFMTCVFSGVPFEDFSPVLMKLF